MTCRRSDGYKILETSFRMIPCDAVNTVVTVPSGTTKKCLLNQYKWMDGESGNQRLKRGHQRRDRDLWILI